MDISQQGELLESCRDLAANEDDMDVSGSQPPIPVGPGNPASQSQDVLAGSQGPQSEEVAGCPGPVLKTHLFEKSPDPMQKALNPKKSQDPMHEALNPEKSQDPMQKALNPEKSQDPMHETLNPEKSQDPMHKALNPEKSQDPMPKTHNPEKSQDPMLKAQQQQQAGEEATMSSQQVAPGDVNAHATASPSATTVPPTCHARLHRTWYAINHDHSDYCGCTARVRGPDTG